MIESRSASQKIFTTIQYLTRQGLALRGHTNSSQIYKNFLFLDAKIFRNKKNECFEMVLRGEIRVTASKSDSFQDKLY